MAHVTGARRPGAGGGLCRDRQEPDAGGGTGGLGGGRATGCGARPCRALRPRAWRLARASGAARWPRWSMRGGGSRERLQRRRRPGDRRGRDGGHAADGAGAGAMRWRPVPRWCWWAIRSSCSRSLPGAGSGTWWRGTGQRDALAGAAAAGRRGSARRRWSWRPGRTEAALVRYEAAGMIRAAAGKEEACAALVEAWSVDRRAAPARSRIMLAATRADVRDAERAGPRAAAGGGPARPCGGDRRRRAGALVCGRGPGDVPAATSAALGVKNGTLGTVERVEGAAAPRCGWTGQGHGG